MEYLVKINIGKHDANRQLLCDICGVVLNNEDENLLYATVYEEKDSRYLEKFICPDCQQRVYPKDKMIDFNQADRPLKEAIKNVMRLTFAYVIG